MPDKIIQVEAQEDFIEKLTVASPAQALAELIWNGLDAEASKVSVEIDDSDFGLRSIRVRDNSHGIPPNEAEELFMHLGGSWKRLQRILVWVPTRSQPASSARCADGGYPKEARELGARRRHSRFL
jgi:histidine kinase/DNA gyrase B/HSP90-like ATPase